MFRWLHIPFLSRKKSEPAPGPAPMPFLKKAKIVVVTALITSFLTTVVISGAIFWLYQQPLTFADPFLPVGNYARLAATKVGGQHLMVLQNPKGRIALYILPADAVGFERVGHSSVLIRKQYGFKYAVFTDRLVAACKPALPPIFPTPDNVSEVPYEQ